MLPIVSYDLTMLSIYYLSLTVIVVQVVLLVAHRVITNIFGLTSSKNKEFNEIGSKDYIERHLKASIKLLEVFSGNISD